MTPAIAALLGRWFWWPQIVRPRPASFMLRPSGPRPLVRAYLLPRGDDEEARGVAPAYVSATPTSGSASPAGSTVHPSSP
jgi:RND superfamily putative drug exporter